MKWRRLGRIFCANGQSEWMHSHGANPVVQYVDNDSITILFNVRDSQNRSHVASLEFDLSNPGHIRNLSKLPLLSPGEIGCFDDSGVSVGALVLGRDSYEYLYYTGWNLGVTVPFRNSIGLAKRAKRSTTPFERVSRAPILDRSNLDPVNISYPFVRQGDSEWIMYYGSNIVSGPDTEDMKHITRFARSIDGIVWERSSNQVLPLKGPNELGTCRPWILEDRGVYRMWFSYRDSSAPYRIGYAESEDGITWSRDDSRFGLNPGPEDWDNDEVCYPCVFFHGDRIYMLYSGNGYGRMGFGVAVLES